VIEQVLDGHHMALANRFMEWSIPEVTWRVNLRASFHQSCNFFHISTGGSDMQRSLPEVANLVYVLQCDLAKGGQILILVAAQDLRSSKALRIAICRHSSALSKLLNSGRSDPDLRCQSRAVRASSCRPKTDACSCSPDCAAASTSLNHKGSGREAEVDYTGSYRRCTRWLYLMDSELELDQVLELEKDRE